MKVQYLDGKVYDHPDVAGTDVVVKVLGDCACGRKEKGRVGLGYAVSVEGYDTPRCCQCHLDQAAREYQRMHNDAIPRALETLEARRQRDTYNKRDGVKARFPKEGE